MEGLLLPCWLHSEELITTQLKYSFAWWTFIKFVNIIYSKEVCITNTSQNYSCTLIQPQKLILKYRIGVRWGEDGSWRGWGVRMKKVIQVKIQLFLVIHSLVLSMESKSGRRLFTSLNIQTRCRWPFVHKTRGNTNGLDTILCIGTVWMVTETMLVPLRDLIIGQSCLLTLSEFSNYPSPPTFFSVLQSVAFLGWRAPLSGNI